MIQGLGQEITEIPAFGHDITEVRAMGQLVWQKSIPDYLCFTALESGTFTLTIGSNVTSSYLSYIEWSKDGRNWNRTDVTSSEQTIEVSVVQDDKVYWRGRGNAMSRSYAAANSSRFSSDCQFNASGNLMSLLTENFETVTSWRYTAAFSSIFNGCTTLISAKDMTIPLATLGASTFQYTFAGATAMTSALTMNVSDIGADCFNSAFQGCSALTDISGLKMTLGTLPNKAFYCAFLACSSLVLPPPITFTSLDTTKEQHCYRMFGSCTSLTSSFPLMPATLASNCYQRMYYGCSSLNYVKCLATDISATNCLQNWLYGVSSTGTFIQAEGVTWPRGASGIPTGWVDVEKRTMPSGYKQVEYVSNPNKGAFNFEHVFDSATETLEIQFFNIEKKGFFIGTTNNGGYYGAICVDKSTNTAIRIKVGIGDVTVNTTTISVTSEKPHVFRYKGKSDGFTIYLNDVAQKVYSGGFNTEHTISNLYVYSAADTASAVETYPDWFGECPLYSIKVLDANDAAIINLIPCVRESDNLVGFYDFGRNKFYFSANGNDFTAGEEI